ncbi:MAG TPA: redox-regulated ATPase YchF [Candidatus Polarisedimenticolia bacterium]|nr:redox-regulated ATPase YchF [Candidatus Polarisedimenticolia bacterium]
MKFGFLGFPKVGKTTLLNILTGAHIAVDKYASGKSQPNVGVARVPEPRLDRLTAMFKPKKTTYAHVDFFDIQGLQKGEAKDSLSLTEMRNVDAIAHVVRLFRDPEIVHSEGSIDPERDIATMEIELILADLEVAQRRFERLELNIKKARNKDDEAELPIIRRCLQALEKEIPIRELDLAEEDLKKIRGFAFLTAKPLLVILNLDESEVRMIPTYVEQAGLKERAARRQTAICAISAKVEEEIAALEPADARVFLDDLGLQEPARDRLIRAAFGLLGLIQFFTAGEDECRAWPLRRGTRAPRAAGTIHSDFERGFIRAEVVAYEDLVAAGSFATARERARLRSEGKDYVVQDGDVINFRFNV